MVSCGFNNENLIEMKIQIENLRAQMRGVQLNGYQRALALDEYYKLLDYVEELEQLTIPAVGGILRFINALRQTDRYIEMIYMNGACYQFHLMLKKFAPECEARITKEKNHIVTYFKGRYFDITGIIEGQFKPLNNYEIEMASKWSFAKNKALQICECPVCEEPIVV